jgi:hypothetical protein
MKPDSSKDKMDVDAGEHEDEGGAAAPAAPTEAPAGDKNAQDPASDGIKAADEAMDGAPKENADQDPWVDNFPLQEQQGALTAAAALFLLCAMLANMCVCLPSLLVDDKVVAKQNHRTTSKRGKRGEPASRLARQRRSLLRRGPLPPATHLHPTAKLPRPAARVLARQARMLRARHPPPAAKHSPPTTRRPRPTARQPRLTTRLQHLSASRRALQAASRASGVLPWMKVPLAGSQPLQSPRTPISRTNTP